MGRRFELGGGRAMASRTHAGRSAGASTVSRCSYGCTPGARGTLETGAIQVHSLRKKIRRRSVGAAKFWQPYGLQTLPYKWRFLSLRLTFRMFVGAILVLTVAWAGGRRAAAHPAQELAPDESTVKARQVLQQVIATLGGPSYLNVRDTQCDGRAAQFGTAGTLMGFTQFRDQWLLPDKNRVEYFTKGEHTILGFLMGSDDLLITHGGALITVFNGKEGWSLDKSGVSNQADDLIQNFNEQIKTSMNNMLRKRMNEPGVDVRYAGTDLIDLKEAEWIEFVDSEHREMRLGVEQRTHLPLRWVVATR